MKKIVALVLCLVLALSLCTVAFAAEVTTTIKKDGYSLADMNNTTITPVGADFKKIVKDAKVETEGTKTTTTYYPDAYDFGGNVWYAVDATYTGAIKLIKDGAVVAYLTGDDLSAGVTKVATSFVKAKDAADRVCGDVKQDAYVIGGKSYKAGTGDYALLNGKVVQVSTELAEKVDHTFTTKTTYNAKGEIVAVKCDTCKADFTTVKATKVPATYAGKVVTLGQTEYVVLVEQSAASTAVDSPKTFDAGIAVYAGMALMSAAGSAVVIGKKKEF